MRKIETIVLAGGCFWGVEELFRKLPGVVNTEVGYSGGSKETATYQQVKTGTTGHAEAIEIQFDSAVLPLRDLLLYFFKLHDPTTLQRQGNDIGSQYRSAIFYADPSQLAVAQEVIAIVDQSGAWKRPAVTELVPLKSFYSAEAYHQDYLQKNPGGYTCHFVRNISF